ncbi:alpha-1,2-mannosyltransferase [Nocardia tenerifensis]|uniref:Alpha-1,2-mannosyltransferase n=1 Tax=Nocardia tenerifensis TaxID=228006 RepID=A0A318KDW7_9NOCA|nr:glycosyltransferase 87 family protein [Nocardia tenerifensis]PXX69280.1 alpha-1,2-mannosyltransferase [Nocardia tenerifensis]
MSTSTIENIETSSAAPKLPPRAIAPAAWWTIVLAGVVAGAYYLVQVLEHRQVMMHLIDLSVYQIAGDRVSHHVSVYDSPLLGDTRGVWEFVYTPFAALIFVPLRWLHGDLYTLVGGLGNFAMLAVACWTALSMLGYRRDRRTAVAAVAVAGLLLWCEPIRQSMAFGQINILLLLIVIVDMALPDTSRWKGVLTGVAAGIKLTPAFFVLYLLVTRRYRAAATAVGALVATLVVGFAVLPKDSLTFWTGAFMDPQRVGVPANLSNESLRGLIARSVGVEGTHQLLWLAGAAAMAAVCLYLARRLSRAGHELPAVVCVGVTMTAVSPFSWVHHWVWLAPLLVYLGDLALRRRGLVAPLGFLATAIVVSGGVLVVFDPTLVSVFDFAARAHPTLLYRNAYIWLTVVLLAVTALGLRRITNSERSSLGAKDEEWMLSAK